MTESHDRSVAVGPLGKALGLLAFFLLLGLGLVGLVLPILPGLLFLLLAVYVLSRVSRRFAFLVRRNSWLRRSFRHLSHLRGLPASDWLRLGFWVSVRGVVNGTAACAGWLGNLFGRSTPARQRHYQ